MNYRQEGVSGDVYKPLSLEVEKDSGEKIICRVYQLVNNPLALSETEVRPKERQPSKTYLDTIVRGAKETRLPKTYIDWLTSIENNGNTAEQTLVAQLDED